MKVFRLRFDENHSLVENKPILLYKNSKNFLMGVKAMYLSETYKKFNTKYKFLLLLMLLMGLVISTNDLAVAVPADSIEVIAKHPEINESSIYQITFLASKPIPSNAIIQVTFPAEFDLSDLMIAGSTTINGGFVLKVDQQVVTMKRSGLGREIPANEKVDIKFAIIKNPKQPADNYNIKVEILGEDKRSILKEDKRQKIIPAKK